MKFFFGVLTGFVLGWIAVLSIEYGLLDEDDPLTTAWANHKGHIELVIGYNPNISPENGVSEGLYDTKLWSVEDFLNAKTSERNERIIVTFKHIDAYLKARDIIQEISALKYPD